MLISSRKVNCAAASSLAFAAVHAAGETSRLLCDRICFAAGCEYHLSQTFDDSFSMPCRSLVRSFSLLVGKLLTKASCLKISPSASMPAFTLSPNLKALVWSFALNFCARASRGCNCRAAVTMADAPSAKFSFSGPEAAVTAASCVALPHETSS